MATRSGTLGRRRPQIALAVLVAVLAVALALVLLVSQSGGSRAAEVAIEPRDGLLDAPFRIEVDDAGAGRPVRLTLSATSLDGVTWRSTRLVDADDRGSISIDGGPLFTSLAPLGSPDPAKAWIQIPDDGDGAITLRVEAREGGHPLGSARATRRTVAADVRRRELSLEHDRFTGRYWTARASDRRHVAVLALGGSEGGYGNGLQARLLASHGYPVLQLAYFGVPGLPGRIRDIPLEYFAGALRWLRARPGVDELVVVGASRGGELALLLGSTYPDLVDGVAAYAPGSAVVPGSWTLGGQSVPPPSNPDPRIPVERIRGPVLLVAGGADQVWNSAYAVSAVRARRLAAEKASTEALTFERAGHAVTFAVPYLPAPTEIELDGLTLSSGGTRHADALARTTAWPRLLALLDRVDR